MRTVLAGIFIVRSLDYDGPSEWPLSGLLASWLLVFSGKQPLHRFSELAAHLQEYFGSDLNVAALYRGKEVLADPDMPGYVHSPNNLSRKFFYSIFMAFMGY
jgi:hypothetical protein